MEFFPMLCENYNYLSQNFYRQYKDAKEYLLSLNTETWDYLSHTPEENQHYNDANSMLLNSAIAAVVFQALSIEAFINLYGAQKIGEEKYYGNFEKKGATTIDKIKQVCLEVSKQNYPTATRAYEHLRSLLKKRDRIVHTKPRSLNFSCIDDSANNIMDFFEQTDFVYADIDEEMQSYENLKKTLCLLDGSAKDLISENIEASTYATIIAVLSSMPIIQNSSNSDGDSHNVFNYDSVPVESDNFADISNSQTPCQNS